MTPPFQAGDILFVRGNSPISKVINHVDGEFSHMAICVSDKSILEAQYMTKTRITTMTYDDYEVVDLGFTQEQRDQIVKLSVDLTDLHYDYLQVFFYLAEYLIGIDRQHIRNNPKNKICSELVAYILLQMNWFICIEDTEKVLGLTPNEIYRLLMRIQQVK